MNEINLIDNLNERNKDLQAKLKVAELALIDARSWFDEDNFPGALMGVNQALEKIKEN